MQVLFPILILNLDIGLFLTKRNGPVYETVDSNSFAPNPFGRFVRPSAASPEIGMVFVLSGIVISSFAFLNLQKRSLPSALLGRMVNKSGRSQVY